MLVQIWSQDRFCRDSSVFNQRQFHRDDASLLHKCKVSQQITFVLGSVFSWHFASFQEYMYYSTKNAHVNGTHALKVHNTTRTVIDLGGPVVTTFLVQGGPLLLTNLFELECLYTWTNLSSQLISITIFCSNMIILPCDSIPCKFPFTKSGKLTLNTLQFSHSSSFTRYGDVLYPCTSRELKVQLT